ncbi:MAG: growth inhibitor PemK [Mycoplasmataceae bacterium CE_OT135]|nr:MAG: PemK [Mycoplasmataceae bacterium CE_OT135]KLL04352.1 MAG: growth inhibitor PemK [Mycoplasmataceae bacterium CE_OT135]
MVGINKKIPQQGEIWLIKFEKLKESRKPFRPCLIISNNSQNENDEEVIVSPLTTEEVIVGETQFFEVPVLANKETGLDEPSRVLLNRIHTVDKELRLIERLGKVEEKTWIQVWKALLIVFTGKKLNDKHVLEVN